MAIGFTPKHVHEYQYEGIDREHFLLIAVEAAGMLGWNVSFVSETGFIAHTKLSWSSYGEEVTVVVGEEVATLKSECSGSQIVDWGKNKKNIEALLSKIHEVRNTLTRADAEAKLTEMRHSFASKEDDVLSAPPLTAKQKVAEFFSFFVPTEGYFVTPILIGINIVVFVLMLISGVDILLPEHSDLLAWGANFRPLTLEGEWWRLFTACFLHIGILHLFLNVWALIFIGLLLEPLLGRSRFLAAYLLCGVAASMTSLWWHDTTISAGASGSIFGMYGVFLALLTTNLVDKSAKAALLMSTAVFVGFNLLNGLKPNSGIDNAGHIGGLISGLIVGYALIPSFKWPDKKAFKYATLGILTIALLTISYTIYSTLPNDVVTYQHEMERFNRSEAKALEIYSLPAGISRELILSEVRDKGIYHWNQNVKLVDSFDTLDLPAPIRERNQLLREYCELRIGNYELIYKAIDEQTHKYDVQIADYTNKIEKILSELNKDE